MKASTQCFPGISFITLHKVVLIFESIDEILECDHSNESSSAVLSYGTVYYVVVLTFESVDEIPKSDHSNESYGAVLSRGTVYHVVKGGSYF